MGFLGFGDGKRDVKKPITSALEAAKETPTDQGAIGNSAMKIVETLLTVGIDGKGPFDSAAKVAAQALKKHPKPEDAISAIVRSHLALAAAEGFVTSVGGFLTMAAAIPANVAAFYLLATRMTAAIAIIRGHDVQQREIRTAVLLSLVGADADELLAKAGLVSPTSKVTALAAKQLPAPALMAMNKAIGFRLVSTAGKKSLTRFGKAVPFLGGIIGAGLDGWLINRVANTAKTEFPKAIAAAP